MAGGETHGAGNWPAPSASEEMLFLLLGSLSPLLRCFPLGLPLGTLALGRALLSLTPGRLLGLLPLYRHLHLRRE